MYKRQVLQDDFFHFMRAAGYTDVKRGERGSTEEHLTVTQFKVQAEQQRLEAVTGQVAQACLLYTSQTRIGSPFCAFSSSVA